MEQPTITEEELELYSKKRDQERMEKRIRDFKGSHFGERYINASLKTVGEGIGGEDVARIYEWWQKRKGILIVIGPPGTGKTHLCAALSELALRITCKVRYFREAGLYAKLREAIEKDHEYGETLKLMMDDDITFIDDVGSIPVNDWRKGVIFEAIDLRYNMGLPTVLTSNFNRAQIEEKYEQRTGSRLFAKENTVINLFGNQDLRAVGY